MERKGLEGGGPGIPSLRGGAKKYFTQKKDQKKIARPSMGPKWAGGAPPPGGPTLKEACTGPPLRPLIAVGKSEGGVGVTPPLPSPLELGRPHIQAKD